MFASLAQGTSLLSNILLSPDTDAMIQAMRQMGALIFQKGSLLEITGFAGTPKTPDDVIQCGNSGIVLRFVGALAALTPDTTILTGDHSIRYQRSIQPLVEGLSQLGVYAQSSRGNGYAPLLVKGPITKQQSSLEGSDSQPVSALLIASAFAPHPVDIFVENPGERPWIDLTLGWLKRCGIAYTMDQYRTYHLKGGSQIQPFRYSVCADFSTAAFSIVAALITRSTLTLDELDFTDIQGDKQIIPLLQKMGAQITLSENKIQVHRGGELQGISIDINDCIDALPILSVAACFAKGITRIYNGQIARSKESDRIFAMAKELRKMGASIEEQEDGLLIEGSSLTGAHLDSHLDHRVALSLCVASLGAKGPSVLSRSECIAKTYPGFYQQFQAIGANIALCT